MSGEPTKMAAAQLLGHYRKGSLSPIEVTRATLDRIDERTPRLNAFCHRDDDLAMAMARDSEKRWRAGRPLGLVDGVPTSIKDLVLV